MTWPTYGNAYAGATSSGGGGGGGGGTATAWPSYGNAYAGGAEEPPPPDGPDPVDGVVQGLPSTLVLAAPDGEVIVAREFIADGVPAVITLRAPQTGDVYAANIDRSGAVLTVNAAARVEQQPGTLYTQVGGGAAGGIVYFFLDNAATSFASTYLDEIGSGRVWLPISGLTVGNHVLKASQTTTPPATGDTFFVAAAEPVDPPFTPYIPPLPPAAPINHWVFQAYDFSDQNSVSEYTLAVNPDSVEQQYGNYQVNAEATTVSNGQVILWEGSAQPVRWRWSGRVLDQAQYEAIKTWGTTRQRIYVTDHFRRRFLVKVEAVELLPVRDPQRPWHHSYTMEAYVLVGEGIG